MHSHGTAVLDRTTEATPAGTVGNSARQRWLARCETILAEALATGNADLLPRLPQLVFCPESDLCPDCQGTGYTWMGEEFTPCYCMVDEIPAYDFPRHAEGEVISIIGMSRRTRTGQAEVWVPCPHCKIGPIKHGPYSGDNMIRVPWVPDCSACNDTGWAFKRTVPASAVFID